MSALSLGIYFGPKLIIITQARARKLLSSSSIPQSAVSPGELEEKVPAEVKSIGVAALFKEELRRNRIENAEANLCLSGKDLIIRTFEMPALPKEELQSAITFEAKKYIPFKVEELVADFQILYDKSTRTNLVLFMGIKKETLDRYLSIFNQLNIKLAAIEYSAFSLIRCLRLSGLSDNGIVAVLAADLAEEDEVNFIVLENGFPLFSRDITLIAGPEEAAAKGQPGAGPVLEKLKSEVRVSLDYFHRKFPTKNITKLFVIANAEFRMDLQALISEVGLPITFVDTIKCIGRSTPFSLNFLKAYSSALLRILKTKIKIDLLAAKTKAKPTKDLFAPKDAFSLLEGLKVDPKIIIIGIIICAATFGFGLYQMQPIHQKINQIISMRPQVPGVNAQASYEELTGIETAYKTKLDTWDALVKKQLYVTEPLNVIPQAIPPGVWLTQFSFNEQEQGKASLSLNGVAYLGDSDSEFSAVNKFVSNLKDNAAFSKYFKDISVTSLDRSRQTEKITATAFSISCKTDKGRE